MCREYTVRALAMLAVTGVLGTSAWAQANPSWRRIAGTHIDRGLAGPATGAVQSVWYTQGGDALRAQTASGRVFETTDFTHWKLSSSDASPANTRSAGTRAYIA